MKIGILITGHPPEEMASGGAYDGYFARLLGSDGFTYQGYTVVDGEMPASVHDAQGWLITGSKHGAYEDHPWISPLEHFIRDCYAAAVPMIGVCFGHQIIAQAMGGTVEKFSGGWSVGAVDYQIGDQTLRLNAWHQDQVVEKPARAKVIGATDFCANAALVYDTRIWTIQPHPEYDHDFIAGLIRHRGAGVVPQAQLTAAEARLGTALDRETIAEEMRRFLKRGESRGPLA
ncbi:MAG: type 1 glutamine amidotransferase [Pseudomonadota bacterium]